MSNDLQFEFEVDRSAKTIFVTKEFDADISLVWDAFTKKEIIDQWWAPQPLISKTKDMDFRVGGRRLYVMANPDGSEIGWQIFHYTDITPGSNFKCTSVFVDSNETPLGPGAIWDLTFKEQHSPTGEITTVSITIAFESFDELEKMIEMGFKEGFTMILEQLNRLLKHLKQ